MEFNFLIIDTMDAVGEPQLMEGREIKVAGIGSEQADSLSDRHRDVESWIGQSYGQGRTLIVDQTKLGYGKCPTAARIM